MILLMLVFSLIDDHDKFHLEIEQNAVVASEKGVVVGRIRFRDSGLFLFISSQTLFMDVVLSNASFIA
jgi:hypothetical protein